MELCTTTCGFVPVAGPRSAGVTHASVAAQSALSAGGGGDESGLCVKCKGKSVFFFSLCQCLLGGNTH